LNARILRVGEVIGSAIDLTRRSVFNQLLIAAVTSKELKIKNDGLNQSTMYIYSMPLMALLKHSSVRTQVVRYIL
jgi:hypothetical protein